MSEQKIIRKTKKRLWLRKLAISGLSLQLALISGLFSIQTALAAPAVTSISPEGGPIAGGTTVTITGSGYEDGGNYFRTITIDNSSGVAVTNYQYSFTMDTATLVTAGKMSSTCRDIKIYDNDKSTALYYWIESGCNSTSTKFWVNIPSMPAATTYYNYMLYGSGINWSSYNDATQVFDFFDNFATDLIGSAVGDKWMINVGTALSGTPSGSGSTCAYCIDTANSRAVLNSIAWGAFVASNSGTPLTWTKTADVGYIADMRFNVYNSTTTTIGGYTGSIIYHAQRTNYDYNLNTYQSFLSNFATAGSKIRYGTTTTTSDYGSSLSFSPQYNTWYQGRLYLVPSYASLSNRVSSELLNSIGTSSLSYYNCAKLTCALDYNGLAFGMDNYISGTTGNPMYVDWFRVRKNPRVIPAITVGTETAVTTVGIAGTAASSVDVNSTTSLTAVTGSRTTPFSRYVTVVDNLRSISGSGANYTYYDSITISSISPSEGPVTGGQTITVTGTNFYEDTHPIYIHIGLSIHTVCTATIVNSTTLTCTSPISTNGAGLMDVDVYNYYYTSNSLTDAYTYYDAPTIATTSNTPRAIVPYFGSTSGGNSITITGTNFYSPATVSFLNSSSTVVGTCDSVTVSTSTTLTCTTPAVTEQIVGIMVTTLSGSVTAPNAYNFTNYTLPTPSTSYISCCNMGITRVAIGGVDLTAAATPTPPALLHTGTSPGLPYSTAFYTNYTPTQSYVPTLYTYTTYSNLSVTISTSNAENISAWIDYNQDGDFSDSGELLQSGIPVAAGGVAVLPFTVPGTASTTGYTRMRVCATYSGTCATSGNGSATEPYNEYEDYRIYMTASSAPTVTGISPNKGYTGGTAVTITGTGFHDGAQVYFGAFGSNPATSVSVVNSTTITATSPSSGLTSGNTYNVHVMNTDNQSGSLSSAFTAYDSPTITGITPIFGAPAGSTSLSITGSNFYDNSVLTASAEVDNVPCTRNSMTLTSFVCTTPYSSVPNAYSGNTAVSIIVRTPSGNMKRGPMYDYSYYTLPTHHTTNAEYIGIRNVTISGESGTSINSSSETPPEIYPISSPPSLPDRNNVYAYYTNFGPIQSGNGVPLLQRNQTYNLSITGGTGSDAPNNYLQRLSAWIDFNRDYDFQDASPDEQLISGIPIYSSQLNNSITIPYNATLGQTRMRICITNSNCDASGNGSASEKGESEDYLVNIIAAAAPYVTSISPFNGPSNTASSVTITGTGFQTGASVTINGIYATSVTVVNSTTITATTPSLAAGGPYAVNVTNLDSQTHTLNSAYTTWAAPTITSVSPDSGPSGATIIVTGTNFYDGISDAYVTIDGSTCTRLSMTITTFTCTTPAKTPGSYTLTLTTPSGNASSTFTYYDPPTITEVNPAGGTGKISISITGTGFYNGASVAYVNINGSLCTQTGMTSTVFTCNTPNMPAGTYTLTLYTPSGSADSTFTYYDAPVISDVTPANGTTTGGTSITITGSNFYDGTDNAYVTIDGNTCTRTSMTSISFTCNTPSGTAGSKVLMLYTTSGSASSTYTYYAAPVITGMIPYASPSGQAQSVTITGQNFYNGGIDASVEVAGVTNACTVTGLTVPTQIICTMPAGTDGTKTVRVTTSSGTSAEYYYNYYPAPTLLAISPNVGKTAGGTTVMITGTSFYDNGISSASVTIDGSVCSRSDMTVSTYTCTTPAGTAVTKDVTITTPSGSATISGGYTYIEPPNFTSITPVGGLSNTATSVTVLGTNFYSYGNNIVMIGGSECTNQNLISSTELTCTTPLLTAGSRDVQIMTPSGTSNTGLNAYTYYNSATITSVEPAAGPPSTLTDIIITGTNFLNGAQVKFDSFDATAEITTPPTTISATSPSLSTGIYDVIVEQPYGTSASLPDGYQVYAAPTIGSVNPDRIPESTTGTVTINGTNFYNNATYPVSVSIGGETCVNPSIINENTITCEYPSQTAGTYDVIVTTGSGAATGTNLIMYYGAPTITGIDPVRGSSIGGTYVAITGTNFYNYSESPLTPPSVFFGETDEATNVTVTNPGLLYAYTPAHTIGLVDVKISTAAGDGTLVGGFEYLPQPIDIGLSTVELFGNDIESINNTYYNIANYNPYNAGLIKVNLREQGTGNPAGGRVVALSAVPADNISFANVDCSDPTHFLNNNNSITDSLGTVCFQVTSTATPVQNTTSTVISAKVINGNFDQDVTLVNTPTLNINNQAVTSTLNFRYRNDNGNELLATPIADTNIPFYNAIINTTFRLRFGLTRNMPSATDTQRFDEFSPSASANIGPRPLGSDPTSFLAFPGGYAIDESSNQLYTIAPDNAQGKAVVYKYNLGNLSQAPTSFYLPVTVDPSRPYGDRIDAPFTSSTHLVTNTFIDSANHIMYFVLSPYYTSPIIENNEIIRIYKVNLITETIVDVLAEELPSTDFQQKSYDAEIDLNNGFLYVTAGGASSNLGQSPLPARVMKIKLGDASHIMTKTGQLILENNNQEITSSVIDLTNQFLYVTTGNPQKIIKIDLDVGPTLPPVKADEITLAPIPESSPNEITGYQSAVIDTTDGYAYFGSSTDFSNSTYDNIQRAFITKIDIDPNRTFEVVSRLSLLPSNIYGDDYYGANYIYFPNTGTLSNLFPSASIDLANGYAFFPASRYNTTRSMPFYKLIRIHLSDFTKKSLKDEMIYSSQSTGMIKGSIFRPSTGRGYLIRGIATGDVLTEFNSSGRQNLQLQVAKMVNSQYCNYNSYSSYSWATLPTTDFILSDSTYFADGDPTTNATGLLYDNNSSFVTGELKDSNATTNRISLGKNQLSEVEYSIRPTPTAKGSYCFRLIDSDPSHLNQVAGNPNPIYERRDADYNADTYNIYAPVTINGVLLSKTSLNIIEGTTTDSYGIKLATAPTGNVVVQINANDNRVILSPDSTPASPQESTITFTTGNWDTFQYITISANNNGTAEGTTTHDITHLATSTDLGYNSIAIQPVQTVVTDYGSSSSNVRATVSGEATFTPPVNFSFPEIVANRITPNFSPAIPLSFSETRGSSFDYVLTLQTDGFCKSVGVCIPLDRVFTVTTDLINSFNTFTPAQISQFVSNYLQNGEIISDRNSYVHGNSSEDRTLASPITLIDTRNVPSGDSTNPLQGDLSFILQLMIDYGSFAVNEIGTYTTTLVLDFNTNP